MTESSSAGAPESGRPIVFRGGTVLTMDASSTVLTDADVLVVGDRVEAVGPERLEHVEPARDRLNEVGVVVAPRHRGPLSPSCTVVPDRHRSLPSLVRHKGS